MKYRARSRSGHRGGDGPPGSSAAAQAPEARCRSRPRGARTSATPRPSQNSTDREPRGRVHLGVLELGQPLAPQRGAPARRPQLVAPVRRPTGRGSRPPSPSGRWSWRVIGLLPGADAAGAGAPSCRARRRLVARRGCPACLRAPSSQRSISWVNETSLENSAPTDSPRWMRLIASPMSGATDSVVILASRLARGSGTESVRTTSRSARVADPVDGRVAQHAVGGARVDLGDALALERADDLDERARRCRSRRRR